MSKAVGKLRFSLSGRNGGHFHGKDVLFPDFQAHAAGGIKQRFIHFFRLHYAPAQGEFAHGLLQALFHAFPQLRVFTHQNYKPAHHFVPLVLEQLVASGGGFQPGLQPGQFHAGGVDVHHCHDYTPSGRYLSSISSRIRFSSLLGSRESSFQPRSRVSSMLRLVS